MKNLTILLVTLVLALTLAACGTPHPQGLVFRTADENLSILFLIPPAEVIPADEVGTVEPDPLPSPPCEVVKGNISGSTGEAIYHVEGQSNFNAVKIDENKCNAAGICEQFFCTESDAQAAGFRRALR